MMGLVVAGPICSSTHCSAQQALYCKPQGRGCVCVLGGGGVLCLSQSLVPSQIPFVSNSRVQEKDG